ncbi:hypothetical protein IQ238_17970 [Pleurocapsales cyanobacterium LEGE 06147]|nr:hypothetical protein [Pleurocapsales cyanobacterium LEGE 06147]
MEALQRRRRVKQGQGGVKNKATTAICPDAASATLFRKGLSPENNCEVRLQPPLQ